MSSRSMENSYIPTPSDVSGGAREWLAAWFTTDGRKATDDNA
ncbi:hypothetical protein ACVWZ7_000567 [Arthrobacter sp. TE12232]